MTRKLLIAATALLASAGLLVASASAGPTVRGTDAKGDGPLQVMSRENVPFAGRVTAATRSVAKPAHGLSESERPRAVQRSRTEKVSPALTASLQAAGSDDGVDVLVTTSVDPAQLMTAMAGVKVTQTWHRALTGFAAHVTAAQVEALKAMPEVERIEADQEVHTQLDSATRWTGATKARDDFGLTGDGDGYPYRYSTRDVVIAVVDTGIDSNHKDLKGKVVGWKDFVDDQASPYDDNGHGTHVSGIAAGAGQANRNMKGVAPGAALVGVKVLDANGSGSFSNVIGGIDWVVEHKDQYNIKVMKTNLAQLLPFA